MAPDVKKAIKPPLSFDPVFESHGVISIGSLASEEINYFLNSHWMAETIFSSMKQPMAAQIFSQEYL